MTLERLSAEAATVELYGPEPGATRWDQELWGPSTVYGAFLEDAFLPAAFYAGNTAATMLLMAQEVGPDADQAH